MAIRYSPKKGGDVVKQHLERALSGLSKAASAYDRAAALNAYVHLSLERANGSSAQTADEVLREGKAVCGGMALTLRELLSRIGLESEYAYTYGGLAAHSMVEVVFDAETSGLFDPYHGLAFYDNARNRPVSIHDIGQYAAKGMVPIYYVKRASGDDTILTRETAYTSTDEDARIDFQWPDLFTRADGLGLAHSGSASFSNIELRPGETLGAAEWCSPTNQEPKPWSLLAGWRRRSGEFMSWAYLLGESALGYRVEHAHGLSGLVPGRRYRLDLQIANSYWSPDERYFQPTVTLRMVQPFGPFSFTRLELRGYNAGKPYRPQVASLEFEASSETATVIGSATGEIVIQSISLSDAM